MIETRLDEEVEVCDQCSSEDCWSAEEIEDVKDIDPCYTWEDQQHICDECFATFFTVESDQMRAIREMF